MFRVEISPDLRKVEGPIAPVMYYEHYHVYLFESGEVARKKSDHGDDMVEEDFMILSITVVEKYVVYQH